MAITGEVNGEWLVRYNGKNWVRTESMPGSTPLTEISIDAYASWKLFSKSLRPKDLQDKIQITGNQKLGEAAVEMILFMT
ncbi:hypothetical protein [Rufibacter hautae]|uniref:SCP2 domain-containing protein n=1 Tax=Rufibacter hautae TaxID=2595005 RepID=A0A5B6TCZ8_9BACT|nr:hypothetical protein [Rufibacter hautae]KAA3436983.1 hypothetical protein FOA19_21650 [Rufibacter hautae]